MNVNNNDISFHGLRGFLLVLRWTLASLVMVLFFSWYGAWAITTERLVTGLTRPLYVTAPPGDTDRLFIVEQHTGQIKIYNHNTGELYATPFLDINGLSTGNEQGLLGLAFHPDYASNGYFFVDYTDSGGTTRIVRYTVSANPDVADAVSAVAVLSISQPQTNHNGGWLAFGPLDGYLYFSSGDGGGTNDDDSGHTTGVGNGQDITNNLLGKILRIDVDGDDFPADATRNYAVPPSNPFVGVTGDDEIWAYGLRNSWRCSFDRVTGDLYIADVGQGQREEINFQPAASMGGENYGWRVMEGTRCNFAADPIPCNDPSLTAPIHEYSHVAAPNGGFSITGGYVYRGARASLEGVYFFADYVTDQVWTFRYDGTTITEFTNRTVEMTPATGVLENISSFGEDAQGNLYITDLTNGYLYRIVPEPVVAGDFNDDGVVNLIDFSVISRFWLDSACGLCGGADANDDDGLGLTDLADFAANWIQ